MQSHLHPCTAHGSEGTSLEKPAMPTSSEHGDGTHSRRRRTEAAVKLAPLHRRPPWWHQLRKASDARVERARRRHTAVVVGGAATTADRKKGRQSGLPGRVHQKLHPDPKSVNCAAITRPCRVAAYLPI